MLIWINGPFGVGKTSVARRLVSMIQRAHLFDPEQIGFMLRKVWPERAADFQDLPIWRELTLRALAGAAAASDRSILVPMSLSNRDYFREIVDGLRAEGVDVRHFTLMAPVPTVRRRNRLRLIGPSSRRWALDRVEPCLARLADPEFAVHIDADRRSAEAIAREILARTETH